MKPGNTGIYRIIKAASYSWLGLKAAFKHEAAFRQECLLLLVLGPLGFWLGHTATEKALLIGSVILVLIVELLNSAIENTVDRFGDEVHTLSGRAKDIGSAAVFVALVNVAVIWGIIIFA